MKEKKEKKLTSTDIEKMWGGDGPYSQVSLHEQTRILDDSISRIFLVVEAEINPFTFEYVKNNRDRFENDEAVLQLLDYAENRGKFGYVVGAGEVEATMDGAREFAERQRDATVETLIRMHKFVIDECNLKKDFGIIEDDNFDKQFVWNEKEGKVEEISNLFFDNKTFIGSKSGTKNNKMRFFFVIAFARKFDFKNNTALAFAKNLKKESKNLGVEIESCETFIDYMLVTTLIPFDVVPAKFIESVITSSNKIGKKPTFKETYFVTNVDCPKPDEIMGFLSDL